MISLDFDSLAKLLTPIFTPVSKLTGRNMTNQYRLYLHPNGYFYHRVKVPADIRKLYGKQIEQSSLQTRDYRDAVRRLPAVIVEVDRAFARFRIERSDELAMVNRGSSSGAAELPLRIDVRRVASAVMPVYAVQQSGSMTVDLPMMSVISGACFKAVGREKNWSAKTEATRQIQIKQFIDICGDKPLNRYSQDNIRHLKAVLFALPPQAHVKKEFEGLSKLQIAEKAQRLKIPGLSAESVRQIMTAANIVFGWARAEYDHTLQNIVQPMIPSPSNGGRRKEKRHGFTTAELQKLFSSPVFTGVESVERWFKPGNIRMQHTGRFWVPLLALFSGARLMEAVQLYREDIGCEHDIWFIDINDNEERGGKRLKNECSVRRIPVHPTLASLGFLDFAATVGVRQRLFPDIEIGPAIQRHRHASKMFNKLLSVAGIKGPKKVWHSLRHSFEQACRDSRVDSAIMDQLQGHTQKGMRGIYGEGYKLPALYDGIQSVRYVGLDLSHIETFGCGSNQCLSLQRSTGLSFEGHTLA